MDVTPELKAELEAKLEAMVDIDVETKLTLQDILANNNLKAFEALVQGLEVNLDTKLDLHSLFKQSFNNWKVFDSIQIQGSSLTSVFTSGVFFVLLLAMIFRDGIPSSVLVAMTGAVVGIGILIKFAKDWLVEYKAVERNLFSKGALHSTTLQSTNNDVQAKQIQTLLAKGNCRQQNVSNEVMVAAKQIQASRAVYMVTDACGQVGAALIGKLDRGHDFTGPKSKSGNTGSNDDIKIKAEQMQKNAISCMTSVSSKIDALTNTARFSTKWQSELAGLKRIVVKMKKKLPLRPDMLLTERELEKKEKMMDQVFDAVKSVVDKFEKQEEKCKGGVDFNWQEIKLHCLEVARVLAYSPTLETWENEAIETALKARRTASDQLADASSAYQKKKIELEKLLTEISSDEDIWILQRQTMDAKIATLKELKRICGTGMWVMKGTPPRNDPVAQELLQFWNSKQWHKLRVYSSGSFSMDLDTNLTKAQRDAAVNYDKAIQDYDTQKESFQKKINDKHVRAQEIQRVVLPKLKRDIDDAVEAMEKLANNFDHSFQAFKLKNPTEYAQITLLHEVSDNIGKVSELMVSVDEPASRMSQLMDILKHDDDLNALLETIEELNQIISNSEDSCVAFLKNIGEWDLKKLMKPKAQHHLEAAEWSRALHHELEVITVD